MSEAQPLQARARGLYVCLAVFLSLIWLATLSARPLFNPDEGRYAEIPREMLSAGDWIIPHVNGLAYIEKPPLQYWATALSFRLLGETEFAARLYTALCALGTVCLVGVLGTRVWDENAGWRSAGMLSGMLLFLILGQLLTLDMSLTFYTTAALTGFLLAQREPGRHRSWMLIAWTAAACGVLTKGLVAAAIPSAVLVLYTVAARDVLPWRRLNARWGLPLFLLIAVPWHWLAALKLEDFLSFFFVHEHLARYLTPEAHRQEPWWFFGAVFLAGTVPWTLAGVRAVLWGWRARSRPDGFNSALFLWIWVVFVIAFFSLSDSKLMPYILPAMPALALLMAAGESRLLRREVLFTAALTAAAGICLAVATLHWPRIIGDSDRIEYFLPLSKPLRLMAAVLGVSGVFVLAQRARDVTHATVFLGVGWCLAWLILVRATAVAGPIYSDRMFAAAVPESARDAPIYSVGTYDQSFAFYLRRPVTVVHYRGELDYGLNRAPDAGIGDLADFNRIWLAQPRGFAMMGTGMFDALKAQGLPMRVLIRSVNKVLVARQ